MIRCLVEIEAYNLKKGYCLAETEECNIKKGVLFARNWSMQSEEGGFLQSWSLRETDCGAQ